MLVADVSPEAIEPNGDEHSPEPLAALHGNISEGIPGDIPGDINGDGGLTSLDALTLLNSINDPEAFPITPAMDLDANNQVDLHDYGLVVAALETQNLIAPLNHHASASASDQAMQSDWGGSTLVSSFCDADQVFLSTLNATRAELVNQLAGATLPSQITGLNEQIAAIDSTIAQVEARLDDRDPYGGDGSGDDGGSTDGTSDDPYGGPGDDDGTIGTTNGTTTSGTTSGSTEPTAFSIQGLRTGMFHDALDGDDMPRDVREGKSLRVAGWVSGLWSAKQAPDLLVSADTNFDGDFNDPDEQTLFESGEFWARSHNEGTHDLYSGFD